MSLCAVLQERRKAIQPGDIGALLCGIQRERVSRGFRRSMLVDPTGKVCVELDEKEGIAFGEIGERRLRHFNRLFLTAFLARHRFDQSNTAEYSSDSAEEV